MLAPTEAERCLIVPIYAAFSDSSAEIGAIDSSREDNPPVSAPINSARCWPWNRAAETRERSQPRAALARRRVSAEVAGLLYSGGIAMVPLTPPARRRRIKAARTRHEVLASIAAQVAAIDADRACKHSIHVFGTNL
jgi:hypothetical protein